MRQVDLCVAGNKRKFAAPAKAPFAELPISNVNAQPLQPGRQQVGKQIISEAQQQAVPASTRQKKKPRVAFGRRVGVTPPRKPQDGDPAVDSQQPKQASADASPDEPTQPQHTTMATGYSTSASRLEAIMQASRAIPEPVSSSYAPAASARPYGRQLQAVATQPVLQDTTHAAVGALHASGSPPACAHAAASLATGQARQVAGAQGRLNVAVTQQHTWQAPYNHAVYADEHSQHPPASDADACSVLHATTGMPRAATTPHACASAAAPDAGTGLPDVARRSDVGLQQQYDTLLTDLAAQQHSQLSTVPHSRLWDHQPPATTPMAAHGAQTVATSADVPCGAIQSVHLEAATGVASTSPVPVRRSAYPASQVVILPDDPFHQQLPQHLHELSQLPQRTFQPSAEPYQAQNASPPDPANLPMQDTSESCSASAQDVQVPAPQPSMAQQTQAHSQDQLAPEPESPGANAESPLPSPTASFALPGAACQDPAMRNPDASSCQVHHDSQGTSADARQPPDRKLLRASLADWLADAVASKLWSAFEKQRQASTPLGAQEPPGSGSCSLMVLPGRQLVVRAVHSCLVQPYPRVL